ncbi:hypothetical protein ACMGD3_08570 [Lysinibacillus sphaericus]|uniref:hypothetical protein n=1 Tax=Lysinibacillus sphaericus TaxID=1421 RepID=UPI001C606464
MHIEKSVSALLHCKRKTVVEITWENAQTSLYEIDTFYDSDNGLEMDDENYKEYHLALVVDLRSYQYLEIGTGENVPLLIKLKDSHEIIYKKTES